MHRWHRPGSPLGALTLLGAQTVNVEQRGAEDGSPLRKGKVNGTELCLKTSRLFVWRCTQRTVCVHAGGRGGCKKATTSGFKVQDKGKREAGRKGEGQVEFRLSWTSKRRCPAESWQYQSEPGEEARAGQLDTGLAVESRSKHL